MDWIHDGYRNTHTYHLYTIIRRRKNKIVKVKNRVGEWLENSIQICDFILQAFKDRFTTSNLSDNLKFFQPYFWHNIIDDNTRSSLIKISN